MVNCKCGESLITFKNPEELTDEELLCDECKKPKQGEIK